MDLHTAKVWIDAGRQSFQLCLSRPVMPDSFLVLELGRGVAE